MTIVVISVAFLSNPVLAATPPKSVYQISPLTDGIVIGTTAATTLMLEVFATHLITPRPVDPSELNSLDRSAVGNRNVFLDNVSDATTGVTLLAPVALDYLDVGASPEFVEDMTVFAETLSINGALVSLFKYSVQRPLPRTYAGTDPELAASSGGYRSFYSGHTSLTFSSLAASSVTLNLRHHAGVWPWLVTVALGTTVAAERVAAGRHFYTDVGIGAIMGTAVGVLVPWLHKRESTLGLSLQPARDGAGLAWNHRF
jgi:membrane-associated phospholipid phosphatase